MLNVIVVDDEPAGRLAITRLIARHAGLNLVGEAASAAAAVALIARRNPDVAFLDIQMAGGDGFRVIADAPVAPRIVFVTAHANHAAKAFDVEAVDFLLKPVQPHRFARTVRRLQKLLLPGAPATAAGRADGRADGTLVIPVPGGRRIASAMDVLAIVADGDDSRLLLAGNGEFRARRSIGAFAGQLPTPPFRRLGRSLILNIERVAAIETISRDSTRVTLQENGQELLLGRKAAILLRRDLPGIGGAKI
jgi:two-component system LytT family response regulator